VDTVESAVRRYKEIDLGRPQVGQQHEHIYIPEGIMFGKKVAVIPPVSMAFSHSGYMEKGGDINKSYTWIDRGSDLGRYIIEADKLNIPALKFFAGTEPQKASIPSPVSGLLIHSSYDFGLGLTAILLPDDEPEAKGGEYMFRSLCRLCREHKQYFLRPSRYWSMGAWTEDDLNNIIDEQLSQQCEYVDAIPKYKGYFDEARTRHPNLRPYIRHLV
jgi:hypothetical protein